MIQNSINQMLATVAIGARLAGYNKLGEQIEASKALDESVIDTETKLKAQAQTAQSQLDEIEEKAEGQPIPEATKEELWKLIQGPDTDSARAVAADPSSEWNKNIRKAGPLAQNPIARANKMMAQQMQSGVDIAKRKEALLKASEEARGMSEQANEVSKLIEKTKLGSWENIYNTEDLQ